MFNGDIVRYNNNGFEKMFMNLGKIILCYIIENVKGDVYVLCLIEVVVVNRLLICVLCCYIEWFM